MLRTAQIRAARALLGWRQEELSKAAGVGAATIHRIEKGSGPVLGNVSTVLKIQEAFEQARNLAHITDWPENALRHSFASYHLALFKNAADTALQLGHHDSRVTFSHYRELVKPKDAERYWNLRPASTDTQKIVAILS